MQQTFSVFSSTVNGIQDEISDRKRREALAQIDCLVFESESSEFGKHSSGKRSSSKGSVLD